MGNDRIHTEQLRIGDAFGQVLEECHAAHGAPGVAYEVVERSDGNLMATDAARYFAEPGDWSPTTRFACDHTVGRVLDIGAGAGRAAAHLQDAGHPVVALDPSPGAVAVCRSRGIQSMFTGNVFELAATTPEPFDTFLLLGNNLGLLAGAEQAPLFLAALAGMAQPGARIIGETTDPYRTSNPAHLDYHDQNRRLGRLPGQLRLRVRHHRIATPWWDYLFCTAEELHQILSPTQWELVETNAADNVDSDGPGGWPPAQWAAILALRP